MHLVTYNPNEKVRTETLKRVSSMVYGAYRSCNPTLTLLWASRIIGRDLSPRDVLVGNLTEVEAREILEHVEPLVPDLRAVIVDRVANMLKP